MSFYIFSTHLPQSTDLDHLQWSEVFLFLDDFRIYYLLFEESSQICYSCFVENKVEPKRELSYYFQGHYVPHIVKDPQWEEPLTSLTGAAYPHYAQMFYVNIYLLPLRFSFHITMHKMTILLTSRLIRRDLGIQSSFAQLPYFPPKVPTSTTIKLREIHVSLFSVPQDLLIYIFLSYFTKPTQQILMMFSSYTIYLISYRTKITEL